MLQIGVKYPAHSYKDEILPGDPAPEGQNSKEEK
jgi:hypothetical protein